MTETPAPAVHLPVSRLERVSDACAWAVMAIGLSVMIGWLFGIDALRVLWPGLESMKFNTALALGLSGAALTLRRRTAARLVLGAVVGLAGAAVLAEYLSGRDFGIDQIFLVARGEESSPFPGRMAPLTAIYLLVSGAALALPDSCRRLKELLALTTALGGAMGLVGYGVGVPLLYRSPGQIPIAVHAATAFLLLGTGILLAVPQGTVRVILAARENVRPIWAGFAALIGLLAGVGILGLAHVHSVDLTARQESLTTWPRFIVSRQLEVRLVHYEEQVRAHVDGEAAATTRAREEALALERLLGEYERLIKTPEQAALAVRLQSLWAEVLHLGNEILADTGPPPEGLASLDDLTGRVRAFLQEDIQTDAVAEQQAHQELTFRRLQSAQTLLFFLLMVGMILSLIIAGAVARRVIEQQTRLMRSEELSRDRQVEVELLYRNAPIGLCTLDREMRFRRINQRMAEINGVPLEDHIGRTVREIVPSLTGQAEAMLRRVLETGQPIQFEFRGETPAQPGVQRAWDERWYPWTNASGEIVGVGIVAEEVTERRRAEEAAREAQARKDRFLATLAHELRSPLAPIRNAAEILRLKTPPDPALQHANDIIRRQVRHMTRLIDDLLDVNRISSGKLELRKERVALATVFRHVLEACRPQIESARQDVTVSLPDEPIHLEADPVRLIQIFANLVDNACKYGRPGGRIRFTGDRQGGGVVVTVEDDGIGIEPRELSRVFEMFAQLPSGERRARGGLGIGLWLVRGLVEMHGGRVEAHSDGPGTGSTFRVRLPAAAPPPARRSGDAPEAGGIRKLAVRRVLIVEDHVDEANSLSILLRMAGCDTAIVHDGLAAVETAASWKPEAILLDIGLPRLDGHDACRRIRKQHGGKEIFIAAMTALGKDEDRLRSREAGFDAHLVKPVEPAILMKVLSSRAREEGAAGSPPS